MSQLPRNAERLAAMRKAKKVPRLPVLVSFAGAPDFNNATLYADATLAYDWRVLSALETEIFVSNEIAFSDVLRQLADIAAVVPARIILTYLEGPRIECGEWRQVTDFKLFDWFPIAIGPDGWPQCQHIVRKLFAELGKSLPVPYDEAHDLVLKIAMEQHQCA